MGSRVSFRIAAAVLTVLSSAALSPIEETSTPDFGQPLRGLTADQLARFNAGKDEFL